MVFAHQREINAGMASLPRDVSYVRYISAHSFSNVCKYGKLMGNTNISAKSYSLDIMNVLFIDLSAFMTLVFSITYFRDVMTQEIVSS